MKLSPLFADEMILQRERPLNVWGEGIPNSIVEITIAGRHSQAMVDAGGAWKATLEPIGAGGPYKLVATSGGSTVGVENAYLGDVWLCSGQSNMAMLVRQSEDGEAAAKAATAYTKLRLGTVEKTSNAKPQTSAKVKWQRATPETAREFSAVGYFFAAELLKDPALADVPIGVIDSTFGGTPCEGWIPAESLSGFDAKELRGSLFGQAPSTLYNAMIAPLTPAAVRGVLWYQGESNADRPELYTRLLPALINSWRDRFASAALPFVIVQLPDWAYRTGPVQWTWIRESQDRVVRATPGASLAVTINTTDGFDLHPKQKREVGRRAALLARRDVYHEKIVASGPVFKEAKVEGSAIRVRFDTAGEELVHSGPGKLKGFALAGEDGAYQFADGVIDGDSVAVTCDAIPTPKTVRYAWAGVPGGTLTNRSGLPAAPFRTDKLAPGNDLEVQPQPVGRRVTTDAYDIMISGDGKVASLGIGGKQFLSNGFGLDGGTSLPGWFGPRLLSSLHDVGPDVLTCGDGEILLTLRFDLNAMKWTIANTTKSDTTFRIALTSKVSVASWKAPEPVAASRDKSKLTIQGIDAIVDSDEGKVLQVNVKAQSERHIVLQIDKP